MLNDADIKRQSSLLRKLQVLARDSDLYKQNSDENHDEGTDPGEQTWYSSSPTHMHPNWAPIQSKEETTWTTLSNNLNL